jgi:hypothetical protein
MTLVTVTLPLDSVMEKSGVSLRPALPDRIHSRRRTTKINLNFPFFIRPDRLLIVRVAPNATGLP